jgi:hypothetical protein
MGIIFPLEIYFSLWRVGEKEISEGIKSVGHTELHSVLFYERGRMGITYTLWNRQIVAEEYWYEVTSNC